MAVISITAANVIRGANAQPITIDAGVAITAGQICYRDTNNVAQLSDANGASAAQAVYGIALNNAAAGQPVELDILDPALVVGGTLVAGQTYYLGETPGSIDIFANLTTGGTSKAISLGIAVSTTVLNFLPRVGGLVA